MSNKEVKKNTKNKHESNPLYTNTCIDFSFYE